MVVAEISVVPIGTSSTGVGDFVREAVRIAQESGLKFELTSMGTNVEGELEKVIGVTKKMHEACFNRGAKRVLTTLKIDDRRDKSLTIEGKKRSATP
ncbi:MAG: MTH1187 family thiamine-binding protein [Candidatus Eisenbacteria bacterium]|nr:MTH1187 family thiamine-binding protein [Candidatus Eisenbacteria bacterium]